MREAATPMREATPPPWRALGWLAASFALFLAATGAFDTGLADALPRFGYWAAVMLAGGLVGAVVLRALPLPPIDHPRPSGRLAAIVLTVAAPQIAVVASARLLVFGERPSAATLGMLAPEVLLVATAFILLLHRLAPHPPADVPSVEVNNPEPEFSATRFDVEGVLALRAEDHYLRVYRDGGSTLVLMRLGEAVATLANAQGAQVHRSWWVARGAVISATRANGKAQLLLRNGLVVPVSRTYAPDLRDAGFF